MQVERRAEREGPPGDVHVSRVFASSPDEARVRRPVDAALLVVAVLALLLSAWGRQVGGGIESWVSDIVAGAPNWVTTLASAGFSLTGLAVLGLVVLVVRGSRWALVRDTIVVAATTLLGAVVLSWWVSGEWPDVLPEFIDDGAPAFPVVRIALTVAVLLIVAPSLTAPLRKFDRRVMGLVVVTALILGYATLSSAVGGIALGLAAASGVRLVFGTSVGIPTLERIAAALADLNLIVTDLAYHDEQPGGALKARAHDDLGEVSITIYGRDSADSAFADRLWRAMWYRDAAWSLGVSRQQLAEHEALFLLLAQRAGIHVPDVVVVGATATGDVLLVTRDEPGRRPLAALAEGEVDDALLAALWRELGRLHAAGLAHGHLDAGRITIAGDSATDEAPGFIDLAGGAMSPSPLQLHVDVVELLVTTSVLVGVERAVAAAVRSHDHAALAAALPTIQPVALSRELTLALRQTDVELGALRGALAEALGVEAPEPVNLRRVRLRDVVMLALALVAANALIGWITSIDLDTFLDEIADASVGWLLVALVVTQLTNVAETISMKGVVTTPLPWGPTMQFQYATSYIGLAVPSDAGRIAMTIRYLQKLGVPTTVAVGQGPFTTVFGYVFDALLLLITARIVGADIELPDDTDFSGFITLVIIIAALAAIAIVVVLAVPKFRRAVVKAVKEVVLELKGALTDPSRAAKLMGGILVRKLLFAASIASLLHAFGEPLPFATVIFVNTAVSWFAGVFPVPGGIGVAEAGFVVGLTAFGVSEPVALATALGHRLLTAYLPPIAGFFTMKQLERNGYL